MIGYKHILILLLFLSCYITISQNEKIIIKGKVVETNLEKGIENVSIRISNSPYSTNTNNKGEFSLTLPKKAVYKLIFSHLSYQSSVKDVKTNNLDTIQLNISLQQQSNILDSVSVYATHKPETLVAKANYSIYDFDFYEDKLILLTAQKSLTKAQIQLSTYEGKIISSCELPKQAGEAKHFFHDYEGYTDVICKDSVFRLDVLNTDILLYPIKQKDFSQFIEPIADSVNNHYYYDDNWQKYPLFNYYYLKTNDSLNHLLSTITNADLMKLYNLEYYYLPSHLKLEARRVANYYKTDKRIVAALMSGFTQSMFYEPLYAPIFILKDTICIFNHHNDYLYHYNKQHQLIDSISIKYHHPKNWREWKKQLFVDEMTNKVYAFFSKDGHHYLKQINYQTGKEVYTYKLKHHSAEKIKIKDGYVYYVYRPFDSTQERFLYREKL
ncbi:MAG: carboxypeptidase-like regulatory domain-containing protein [Bacteroidota bacterium]|nr:carboxypeptidase-like regulatory domain-containing protein [Bacteroidota bacterium]MDP3146523.1 carboxypeptidase-like regulatory domain-containing protein [Bacteroidota bacterium]